jgi:hypothetical protein
MPQSVTFSFGPDKAGVPWVRTSFRVIASVRDAREAAVSERDSYAVTALADIVDRLLHAAAARFTLGLSPAALTAAYLDWATHLFFSPGKQFELVTEGVRKTARLANYGVRCAMNDGRTETCIEPLPQDKRFAHDAWQHWPQFHLSSILAESAVVAQMKFA